MTESVAKDSTGSSQPADQKLASTITPEQKQSARAELVRRMAAIVSIMAAGNHDCPETNNYLNTTIAALEKLKNGIKITNKTEQESLKVLLSFANDAMLSDAQK